MSFDVVAANYDQEFTQHPIGLWLRQRIQARLAQLFSAGDVVLEIGCGTGEDAIWLAQRGIKVVATDASPMMLEITQRKVSSLGLDDFVTCRLLDLNQLPLWKESLRFNGVFSNFGPINCTERYSDLADFLMRHLQSGAKLGFGVMSPFCLWESVWHSLHLDFKTAFRRLKKQQLVTFADGTQFLVYYPSVKRLMNAFMPHFKKLGVMGLGVWVPPSDIFGVLERHPRLLRLSYWLERQTAAYWPFRTWADHYWLEMAYV
ncbi:MAG: hypothetical protein CUN55_12055 [Phototrophicales bacterium]|nr:MAG: hypothetical protein CUN55_12055 [Phototrophicales bacterium]